MRYELLHGGLPPALTAVVPEFLPDLPHDYMDGQALRYRVNRDGSFTLYSVAEDGMDGGGDSSPAQNPGPGQSLGPRDRA